MHNCTVFRFAQFYCCYYHYHCCCFFCLSHVLRKSALLCILCTYFRCIYFSITHLSLCGQHCIIEKMFLYCAYDDKHLESWILVLYIIILDRDGLTYSAFVHHSKCWKCENVSLIISFGFTLTTLNTDWSCGCFGSSLVAGVILSEVGLQFLLLSRLTVTVTVRDISSKTWWFHLSIVIIVLFFSLWPNRYTRSPW